MSDFLVNVVRRGAALPLGMSIQPSTMLDFSPVIGEMEVGVADQPPSPFEHESYWTESGMGAPMREVSETALEDTPFPTPRPGIISPLSPSETPTPQTPLPPTQLESHIAEPTATAPVGARAKADATSQDSPPPTDQVPGMTLPSAEDHAGPWPRERLGISLPPRENGAQGREPLAENQLPNLFAPGESPQPQPSRLVPPPLKASVELVGSPMVPEEAHPQIQQTPSEGREGGSQLIPRSEKTWEVGGTLGLWYEGDEASTSAPESPHLKVRIGRVEIRVAKPPMPSAPASPQRPNGFVGYTRARSYRDRKWY
jgi:hypothetical protein